jgi:hypothetical protein
MDTEIETQVENGTRIKLHNQGFYTPDMVRHVSRMLGTYLWLGDMNNVRTFAALAKEILSAAPRLAEYIDAIDMQRLLYVCDCLDEERNPVPWKSGPKENTASIMVPLDMPGEPSEKDLQRILLANISIIGALVGGDVEYVVSEAPVESGRIDIFFRSGRRMHVMELKIGQADHRVIGQVQKYMRDAGSKIHYRLYDDVIGWVLARDFTDDARRELSLIGVRMVSVVFVRRS